MTDYRSFVEILYQRARYQPSQKAYTFLVDGERDERTITYDELDRRARAIGALLQTLDAAGERVLLLYPAGLEYIAAFYGCLYAGAIAVPSYPPRLSRPDPRLQTIVKDSGATIALTTNSILSSLERRFAHMPGLENLRWIDTDSIDQSIANEWTAPDVSSDQTAFLQYTSGSTSTPKGVMVTHANILHNSSMIQHCFGHSEDSCGVIWLPPYHDMGLIGGILQPLYTGFPVVLMSPTAFLQKPLRWLDAISRYRGTTSGGPNFAYDLCVSKISPEERQILDLSSWDLAFNGAEPIRPGSLDHFVDVFAPYGFQRQAFYPCYGLAEATLIVSGGEKASEPVIASFDARSLQTRQVVPTPMGEAGSQSFVSCGRNLPQQELIIVDPDSCTLSSPTRVGEVWVQGPSIADGYWQQPEETAKIFGAHLHHRNETAYLRTGDLGFIQNDELFIIGRSKDLIIIRGRNYYPQDIEAIVEISHPAIQPGCGAAFSTFSEGEERLIIVQEMKHSDRNADCEPIIRAIRLAIAQNFELQAYTVVLLRPTGIPKTSSGKIQRNLCKTQFLAGQLNVVGQSILSEASSTKDTALHPIPVLSRQALLSLPHRAAQQTEVQAYLQRLVAQLTGSDTSQIDIQEPAATFGVDSLMAVDLLHRIEVDLAVRLPLIDLLGDMSLAELADSIVNSLGETNPPPAVPLEIESHPASDEQNLSYGQKSIWFLHQFAPESAAYNIACAARIHGALDGAALQRAFEKLVQRHASLRATFSSRDGEPIQIIQQHLHEKFFFHEDVSKYTDQDFHRYLADLAHQPFDLEQGPLLRVGLFDRAAEGQVLLFVIHHVIADFWSLAILLKDLEQFYLAECSQTAVNLPTLEYQHSDFVRWQTKNVAGPVGDRMWNYWQKQLSGKLPLLQVHTENPRSAAHADLGAAVDFDLPPNITARLREFCRTHRVTPYMTLLSAFQLLLHIYTGQDDLLIGSPMANRENAGFADLIGYFINPVVIRTKRSDSATCLEYLDQTRRVVLDALANQGYPFELLVKHLHPDRYAGQSPVFQAMFTMQQTPALAKNSLTAFALGKAGDFVDFADLRLESVSLERRFAQFDLNLVLAETQKGMSGYLQYRSDLFNPTSMTRMTEHFMVLLENMLTKPAQLVSKLSLVTAKENDLIRQWNATRVDFPPCAGFHELIALQTRQTPERLALFSGERSLSYASLEQRSNQWAHYLQQLGVKPGVLVGVFLDRSLEMPIVLLGILKAGGAYVPLDPEYPEERLRFMITDSRLPLLIVQEAFMDRLPAHNTQVICLERAQVTIERQSIAAMDGPISGDDLAYVIYTSGSTGRPKGVQIPHQAVSNFLQTMRSQPWISAEDRLLAVTTLCFDIAVLEIFLPLTIGAGVVLASRTVASHGETLIQAIENNQVTLMQATPATWHMLVEAGWKGNNTLKVLCGGEALSGELAQQLLARSAGVWNLYGPTEATVWAAIYQANEFHERVPIGRPICNLQIFILDTQLQPTPIGVAGEAYIGGIGLARGYLGQPALTAEKFIPDPFSQTPGARLYRTGDLARTLPDGNIDFLGRLDQQVKIRGHRIELGEIESVLSGHAAIQDVVVVGKRLSQNDSEMIAYVVFHPGQYVSLAEMRAFIKEKLPDYMLPSLFVALDALPLTPNRKVDRNALPEPKGRRMKGMENHIPPRTETEKAVAAIWRDVLQIEQVGMDDNFFELGGHSLLAAKMVTRLRQAFMMDLSLQQLFEMPTVAQLAKRIEESATQNEDDEIARMLEMVEQLSDAEVKTRLAMNNMQGEGEPSK